MQENRIDRIKRALRAAPLCVAMLGLSVSVADTAAAQWYVEGQAGAALPGDSELDGNTFDVDAEIDPGLAGLLTIGYDYDSLFRTGLELGYRQGDIDKVGGVDGSGDVDVLSAMINIFYDFDIGQAGLEPFVGLGFGAAQVDADAVNPVNGGTINDDDIGLAGQVLAGLAYNISDTLALTGTYSYLYVPSLEFSFNGSDVDSDYSAHTVLIGLRYSFAPPAPAPAAAPAAQPAAQAVAPAPPPPPPPPAPEPPKEPEPEPIVRNFIVFFDWDQALITPEARGILGQAYDFAQRGGVARIVATGHADRSGTVTYNQKLSARRAAAVREALVNLGFPANGIATEAKGENDPLVPTEDGVREPQNRRVEIVLE